MIKKFVVESACNDMRLDRWLRNKLGKIPQSFIEKNLRIGKIKINKKKVKSSFKLKTNDKIDIFNFKFKENIQHNKKIFNPSNEIIKSNEDLIIDNNEDFIVLNKSSGISVQGGTKSKKNLVDIFAKSEIFQDTKPYSVHRLDKDTSGVFIMAKNRKTAQLLTSLFRLRKVYKTYLAICHGEIEKNYGEWNDELIRYENGKKIIEKAKTIEAEETFVEAMDVDNRVLEGLEEAVEKARTGEIVDFDTLFDELNGEDAIRARAMQNVNEFITVLKETGAYSEISKEISQNLGKVQEGSKRNLEIVKDETADLLMDMYNMQENDLDFNIAQIFLNDHTNTIGINQLILGDEAYSLKDAVDKINYE